MNETPVDYYELHSWGLAELRFEHDVFDGLISFDDEQQAWIVEYKRKPVGIIPWSDFPEVIAGNPEDWLIETAGRIIDASR